MGNDFPSKSTMNPTSDYTCQRSRLVGMSELVEHQGSFVKLNSLIFRIFVNLYLHQRLTFNLKNNKHNYKLLENSKYYSGLCSSDLFFVLREF